jgi:hypothetical protein
MPGTVWTSLTLLAFLVQATLGAQFSQADVVNDGGGEEHVQADPGLKTPTPLAPSLRSLTGRRVLVYRAPAPTPLAASDGLRLLLVATRSELALHASGWRRSLPLARIRLQI